jgi:hypothetical protein
MKNESIITKLREDTEYQDFFKRALDKAGKSIPSMSDDEKKAFFNKIDAAWNGKKEKREVNESDKTDTKIFSINPHAIGKAKYSIDIYDGKSTHGDGSPFIGIATASSKGELKQKIARYKSNGYSMVDDVYKSLHI